MDRPVQRYKLTIAYRGTQYHGWQEQGHSSTWKGDIPADGSGPPTIQELTRRALEGVVHHPVLLHGSSRTDAGVHAKGQVAHFDTHMVQIPPEGLRRAVNSRLPGDILVRTVEPVPPTFDAIGDTERKRYQYVIWNTLDREPFSADLAFHRWQTLNIPAMAQAAAHLEGTVDLNAFSKPGHGRANTIRTIYECAVRARGPRVILGVTGSGFLWNTVRIIAGTLIEVGLGRYAPDDIPAMLASRDRRTTGSTAPPHGLYLHWIQFRAPVAPPDPSGDPVADTAPSDSA